MLKAVHSANHGRRGVSRACHDELIVGADAAVGVRIRVEDAAAGSVGAHARLGNVERVEVKPQLTNVQVCL